MDTPAPPVDALDQLVVVSYHTDDAFYREHAAQFQAALKQNGIPNIVMEVPRQGRSWPELCALKAHYLLSLRLGFRHPILWVDIDGRIQISYDNLRAELRRVVRPNTDLAVFRNRKDGAKMFAKVNSELMSGTMLFMDTQAASRVIYLWTKLLGKKRYQYEQDALAEVLNVHDSTVIADLHPSLICVPDLMPGVEPLILHTQASRDPRSGCQR